MVNFDDVESVSRTNKLDKVKYDILNRRQTTIDSYRQYTKYKAQRHPERGLIDFKIELGSLYREVKQMILREIKKEKDNTYKDVAEIEKDLESEDDSKVIAVFDYIDALLYKKKITQLDTRETTDTTDVFEMNKKGYY